MLGTSMVLHRVSHSKRVLLDLRTTALAAGSRGLGLLDLMRVAHEEQISSSLWHLLQLPTWDPVTASIRSDSLDLRPACRIEATVAQALWQLYRPGQGPKVQAFSAGRSLSL